jgi:hypothetical protein
MLSCPGQMAKGHITQYQTLINWATSEASTRMPASCIRHSVTAAHLAHRHWVSAWQTGPGAMPPLVGSQGRNC